MKTSHPGGTTSSNDEEPSPLYFGEWVKRRRVELDLTQAQLAKNASCTVFTIRKIEMGERRPSKQLAGLLAQSLQIPCEDQATFLKAARGELGVERLAAPARASDQEIQPARPGAIPTNLPRALTPFIGREPELATLGQLLADAQCSLLTIVGPGGIGKTRLAIEAAGQHKALFPDGVWFVPLAPLNSPALLVPAIADAINYRFQEPTHPQAQLLSYLCEKRVLLVLDNAEHLLEGVGIFTEILNDCQQAKLLVTSRERLNLLSEWVFEVQGLPVPEVDQAEQFEAYSSVALFVRSARRALPAFVLDEASRSGVAAICRLVEGMPLAIELAAAWVRMLSPTEIAAEIKRSLDFLNTSARDVPERHRSMRAVFDRSWQMLSAEEQQALNRLSVFRGGFTREAAEQVAGVRLERLSALVAKSLVQRNRRKRFGLHELVRQYAASRLETAGETKEIQRRHIAFFTDFAEKGRENIEGPLVADWLEWLDLDNSNLRAAIEYAIALRASCMALRMGAALYYFWEFRGYMDEGRHWLDLMLDLPDDHTEDYGYQRWKTLVGAGGLAAIQGDYATAHRLLEESLASRRQSGDVFGIATSLSALGSIMAFEGKHDEAWDYVQESLELYRKLGNQKEIYRRLNNLGSIAMYREDYEQARSLFEESLRISRGLGNRLGVAFSLSLLGELLRYQGEYGRALEFLQESLAILREVGEIHDMVYTFGIIARVHLAQGNAVQALVSFHDSLIQNRKVGDCTETVNCLEGIAEALAALERCSPSPGDGIRRAVRLLAAADRLRGKFGEPRTNPARVECDRVTAQLRGQLSASDFWMEWQHGAEMTTEQAVECALLYVSQISGAASAG